MKFGITGMRPGELVELQHKDLDFTNNIIKVRRTRMFGENGPTKTNGSVELWDTRVWILL